MAQKRAAGKPKERRRVGARQNPEGQLEKRVETRNTPGPRAHWKPGNMIYPVPAQTVKAPVIAESPVAIECRVTEVKELGSHHMFLAEVTGVSVDEQWLNERGGLELAKAEPIVYSHGGYYGLSELLGTFGWSVKKKRGAKDEK